MVTRATWRKVTATFPTYTNGGWDFDGYTTLSGTFQARKGGSTLSL